jgi:hypothetical protein
MSLRLIKPGLSATGPASRVHPRTGEPIEPIGYIRGRPIWPIMGAAPDPEDPDDPDFVGGGDDDDESDDDESDDDDEPKKPVKKTGKHTKDDDEEDDDKPIYSQYEYDRVKTRMRKADQRSSALEEENRKLKAQLNKPTKDKPKADVEDDTEDLEGKRREQKREEELQSTRLENAFLRSTVDIQWVDEEDAFAVGIRLGLFEDVLDDDGTVDRRAMARALRELAKRKPHLVKPKRTSGSDDDEDEDDEPEARPRTRTMNGRRKGSKGKADRAALEAKFPALGRR